MPEAQRPPAARRLAAYFQVLPTWAVLGFFFVLPLVIMLVISFGQRGTYGGLKAVSYTHLTLPTSDLV